ncbi:copper-translocating P-type ATPase [Candidatus Aerophobetes bacterium]|uniref:Copper-translocating P-type ATPase n=1 Tax=Aerophobetes bacterium TaxID=2030807 RepID=A0A2A4X4U7_UNCAE|nr:MAG: copper-translocating P-type ATPase [Candidatus Aerophobetes bacterium]
MEEIEFILEGIHCASCVLKIEKSVKAQEGVNQALVNFGLKKLYVKYDKTKIDEDVLRSHLTKIGYTASLVDENGHGHSMHADKTVWPLVRMLLCIALTVPFFINMAGLYFWKETFFSGYVGWLLASLVEIIGGSFFILRAFQVVKKGGANMDVLVSVGTMSAYLLSTYNFLVGKVHLLYFESSAMIITFVLIGLFIEEKTQMLAQEGLKDLLSLQPQETIVVKPGGEQHTVLVSDVQIGDEVLVKAGQIVPVDGLLTSEEGFFDESSLTGESFRKHKKSGEKVFAGTLNSAKTIYLKAQAKGKDTVIGKTLALVEKASNDKPAVQRLADTISSFFVPLVIGIAILTFLIWFVVSPSYEKAILAATSVLVIACPCALGMATPIVTLAASVKMAKAGVLIRQMESFSKAYKIKNILFDKTGTLTTNKLSIEAIESKLEEKEYALLLLAISHHSDHPIGKAITAHFSNKYRVERHVKDVETFAGRGIRALFEGKTIYFGSLPFLLEQNRPVRAEWSEGGGDFTRSFLFVDDMFICRVDLKPQIKEGAKKVIEFLKKRGVQSHLVSGDSQSAALYVAKEVGIERVKAEALPEDKLTYLESLSSEGLVAMVGDGINDAPALLKADVSFAMGDGVDVAMESASIGLVHGDLADIEKVFRFSKKSNHTIYVNFIFAFLFNVIGIVAASLGLLRPAIASAAMALSSILVVANSTLLLKRK